MTTNTLGTATIDATVAGKPLPWGGSIITATASATDDGHRRARKPASDFSAAVGIASVTLTSTGTSLVYGEPVTFTAATALAPGSGSVTFYDGAIAIGTAPIIVNGTASFTTTLGVGTHQITAQAGTTTSAALTETVTGDPISIGITPSANPAEIGPAFNRFHGCDQPPSRYPLQQTTPTGFVQFYLGKIAFGSPVPVVNGVAVSPSISTLALGSYTVSADYSDASGDSIGSADVTLTARKGCRTTPFRPQWRQVQRPWRTASR